MTVCALSSLLNISIYANWSKDDKGWSYQKEDNTYLKSEWLQEHGRWYYFNEDAYMATSWVDYQDKWYYFNQDGVMQKNTKTPDGYKLGADGAILEKGRSINSGDITDIQKRVMSKSLVVLLDLHSTKDKKSEVLYKTEDFQQSKMQLLFFLLKHIDNKELFESLKMASSDTDENLKHKAVSMEEAVAVCNTLYDTDISVAELVEYAKSEANTEFFTFENNTYIAKQRVLEGNVLPVVSIDKYVVDGDEIAVVGTASLNSGNDKYKLEARFNIDPPAKYKLSLKEVNLKLQ